MFNDVEQALNGVARSSSAWGVSEVEMCNLVETKAVADEIIKSILSKMRIIVPIADTVEQMVERAGNEYGVRDMEEAWTTATDNESFILRLPPYTKRQFKILSRFESQDEHRGSRRHRCSASNCNCRKKQY